MNAEMRQARRALTFWDGKAPEYDASILMTAYNSENTIGEAIRSIYAQNIQDGVRVQLVIGVDPSPDATLEIAQALAAEAPDWLTVEVSPNELPNVKIDGRRTARSNFMLCYARLRGELIAFLNHDDIWLTPNKLQRQIDCFRETGAASCTSLETDAVHLKRLNDAPEVQDPFANGTTVLISSFAMPYIPFGRSALWWTLGFLDLAMICYCYERHGIRRFTDEKTFYRVDGGGSWSKHDARQKGRWIRKTCNRMALFGPFSLANRWRIFRWGRRQ